LILLVKYLFFGIRSAMYIGYSTNEVSLIEYVSGIIIYVVSIEFTSLVVGCFLFRFIANYQRNRRNRV
jgi:hypothetical protein